MLNYQRVTTAKIGPANLPSKDVGPPSDTMKKPRKISPEGRTPQPWEKGRLFFMVEPRIPKICWGFIFGDNHLFFLIENKTCLKPAIRISKYDMKPSRLLRLSESLADFHLVPCSILYRQIFTTTNQTSIGASLRYPAKRMLGIFSFRKCPHLVAKSRTNCII